MNKRRLLKLADMLEADAKNKRGIKFDIRGWGYVQKDDEPLSCGTTACAMGYAALSGQFKRAGLTTDTSIGNIYFRWRGREVDGFTAARRLFKIDACAAGYLFSATEYDDSESRGARGERAVAKRIRKFATGDGRY